MFPTAAGTLCALGPKEGDGASYPVPGLTTSCCLEVAGKAAGEGREHPDDGAGVGVLEAESGEDGNEIRGRRAPGFPEVSLLLMWDDVEMPLGLPDTFLSSPGSARKWCPEIYPHFWPFLWGSVCPGPPVRGQLPLQPVTGSQSGSRGCVGSPLYSPPSDDGDPGEAHPVSPCRGPFSQNKSVAHPALCKGAWLPL